MKSGASDPFADDSSEEHESEEDEPTATREGDSTETDSQSQSETQTEQSDETVSSSSNTDRINRADLPLTLRRDTVKDERENVHQLFVQDSTNDRAKDAERDLETLVGEDVYRLDAREAIYLAGMQNLGDAAEILREWGYDL
ncbi:hypothetical protein [Haladaptatus sp. NG-SE-30]